MRGLIGQQPSTSSHMVAPLRDVIDMRPPEVQENVNDVMIDICKKLTLMESVHQVLERRDDVEDDDEEDDDDEKDDDEEDEDKKQDDGDEDGDKNKDDDDEDGYGKWGEAGMKNVEEGGEDGGMGDGQDNTDAGGPARTQSYHVNDKEECDGYKTSSSSDTAPHDTEAKEVKKSRSRRHRKPTSKRTKVQLAKSHSVKVTSFEKVLLQFIREGKEKER